MSIYQLINGKYVKTDRYGKVIKEEEPQKQLPYEYGRPNEYWGGKSRRRQEDADEKWWERYNIRGRVNTNISIAILPTAYKKIEYYVNAVKGEVSGLMLVTKDEDKYTVSDVFILHQRCSSGYTDLDKDAMVRFISEYGAKGYDLKNLRGWWHSHADMSCFWSGTDEATAGRFGFDKKNQPEWWVSIVANKAHNMRGRIDVYDPIHECLNDDVKPHISIAEDKKLREECEKDVKEKVREIVYKYKRTRKRYKDYREHKGKKHTSYKEKEGYKEWYAKRKKWRFTENGTYVWFNGKKYIWNGKTFRASDGSTYPVFTE